MNAQTVPLLTASMVKEHHCKAFRDDRLNGRRDYDEAMLAIADERAVVIEASKLAEMQATIDRLTAEKDRCGVGAGCLYKDATIDQQAEQIAALEKDAALGRLVRLKMTSGNSVPVERCTVYDHELVALAAKA